MSLPKFDGMTDMDALWVVFWHKRKGEIESGDPRKWADRGSANAALDNLKSLIQQQSPAAWREITMDARMEPYRRD